MNPLLLPVVAVQGLWLRSTVVAAPEPAGPAAGAVDGTAAGAVDGTAAGAVDGTVDGHGGTPLGLGVVGESTAAGCGVARHDEGFAAALATELAARTGGPVRWKAVGRYGATARRIRHRLVPRLSDDLNLVVVLAGVNDVLTRSSPERWRDDLTGILAAIADRTDRIVVAGIPPFTLFPALPAVLARYLAERAAALDAVTRQVCGVNPERTLFVPAPAADPPPGFFAADRFHPSAIGYRHWAVTVADALTL